jgi:preprotein translocase subunit SecE
VQDSISMDKIKLYLKESYNELVHKVTWPSWGSLQSNTILVLVASIIFALFILVMDAISKFGTDTIYGL